MIRATTQNTVLWLVLRGDDAGGGLAQGGQ